MKKYSVVILSIALFALVGCGQSPDEPSNAPTNTPVLPTNTPTNTPVPPTNTHVFSGFGFSIDYPEGWLAETRVTITHITELEEDHANAFRDDEIGLVGYAVTLDHRTRPFMQSIGLQADSTLDDLLEFNADTFGWQVSAVEETQIFGVPALRAKVVDELGVAFDEFMGFIGDEVFLFGLGAPSEDARDEFTSRWEEMLDSIQPVEG